MAAISNLVFNDTIVHPDSRDDERSPITPRADPRLVSSMSTHENPNLATDATSRTGTEVPVRTTLPNNASPLHGATAVAADEVQDEAHPDDDVSAMDVDTMKDDSEGAEDDVEQGEGSSGTRKKKGQRFFCTGYPPCNLSFTRSEHLARHIRKHTGERPFQCHCNRRFSRLDNLRQHAQTVHVNEEIPTDSLAATGTRFQRQIRTDRVRPSGRPRTNTMSSTGSHSRGHSRNLSTSSIGSIASTTSNYSTTTNPRHRPPPLLMASDGSSRPSLALETPGTPPPQYNTYSTNSPGDMQTPTSTTFSVTPGSPHFGSNIVSPTSAAARMGPMLGGSRTPGRRLSVPAAPPPYNPHYGPAYGAPNTYVSASPSTLVSPTTSAFPYAPGFPMSFADDWRRRTWHPSTYPNVNFNYARPATSGLTYSQTPDAPQPAFAQNATAAAGQAPRLPGIESFDHMSQRPTTPSRRNASPGSTEVPKPTALMPAPEFENPNRRHHHRHSAASNGYPDLEDGGRNSSSWVQETIEQINQVQQAAAGRDGHPLRNPMGPPTSTNSSQQMPQDASHLHSTGDRAKRGSWYSGPGPAIRTSPEDSSSSEGVPTPGTSATDLQPAIVHSNGMIESNHQMLPTDPHQISCLAPHHISTRFPVPTSSTDYPHGSRINSGTNINPLDALVAAATREKFPSRTTQ